MINKTKLFAPSRSENEVTREHLLNQLSVNNIIPVILVTAPMGYGKSSLVSSWINNSKAPYFWYSLDKYDNDLKQFISYFSQAIPQNNIDFHLKVKGLLNSLNEPEVIDLINLFSNSLLEHKLKIIFDDFHLIHEPRIIEFVSQLVETGFDSIQFIVIARSKPNFPITVWRSKGLTFEIHTDSLQFNLMELKEFTEKNSNLSFTNNQLELILKHTEGWVSGLKLWYHTNKNEVEIIEKINSKNTQSFEIVEELILEILDFHKPYRELFLKLSIVDKFNLDLLKKLVSSKNKSNVEIVFNLLKNSNLFLISLDDKNYWYRLHHMFQSYLQQISIQEFSSLRRKTLHKKAAKWFQDYNFHFEAINHYIKAGDIHTAIYQFSQIRNELLNENNWSRLTAIFELFRPDDVQRSIELQLIKSWILVHQGKLFELFESFENLSEQIENDTSKDKLQFKAEFNCLLPYKTNNVEQDFEASIKQCQFSLEHLDNAKHYQKGYAWIFLGGALQMNGRYNEAAALINTELVNTKTNSLKQNLLFVLCYIHWMEANITELYKSAKALTYLGEKNHINEAKANGYYFLGSYYFIQNNIEKAEKHFMHFYKLRNATIGVVNYMGSICLSQIFLEQNKTDSLHQTLSTINEYILKTENQYYIKLLDAMNAEYHLSNNQIDKAWQSVKGIENLPLTPFYNVYAPIFTYLKVLLYKNKLAEAYTTIIKVSEYLKETNNHVFSIYIQLYEVFYLYNNQQTEEAVDKLQMLIERAENLNISRPFIELSKFTTPILPTLESKFNNSVFYRKISNSDKKSLDSYDLTRRELEILPLLKLSDKEISEKLFIAIKTVKRHNGNIFKKFSVKKRIQAYQKAKELNII